MKKILLGSLIFVGVLLIGLMVVRGQGLYSDYHFSGDETTETSDDDSWRGHGYGMMGRYNGENYGYSGCHGYYDETPSYEYLYIHLSFEDQEKIDILYAEMIGKYDFTLLTQAEKLGTIESVKDQLVEEILENDEYQVGW